MAGDVGGWPLVGREPTLAAVVDLAARGRCSGVVVVGARGAGRTRLARAALAAVAGTSGRSGAPRWAPGWITASRSTRDIPWGAMSHLLAEIGAGDGAPARLLHEARRRLLESAGDDRLLLAVDDVHLLDEMSAVLLHQLAAGGSAFLVLTTPTGHPVPDPIFALWKEGLAERLDLPGLSRDQSHRLVVQVLGGHVDGSALEQLWRLSLGNPLYLRELVEAATEAGTLARVGSVWRWNGALPITPRLVEMVHLRAGALDPGERDFLRLLAFGQPLGTDLAGTLSSPDTLLGLEQRGVISSRRVGRRVEVGVAQPLHAEILRAAATPLQEREAYHRLESALSAHGARRREDRQRLLAWRTAQGLGGDPTELLAASSEIEPTDVELAEKLVAAAVSSGGGPLARRRHGRVLVRLGRAADAESVLSDLAADPATPENAAGAVASLRAHNLVWGLRDVRGALGVVREVGQDPADPMSAPLGAFAALLEGADADAVALAEPVWSVDERPPDPAVRDAALTARAVAAFAHARLGQTEAALRCAGDSADSGAAVHEGDDPTGGWLAFELVAAAWYAHLQAGDLDTAEALATERHGLALAARAPVHVALYATWRGIVAARRGRPRTASGWLHEAAAAVVASRFSFAVPLTAELAMALATTGDHASAAAVLDEGDRVAEGDMLLGWREPTRVWLAGAAGRISQAEKVALAAPDTTPGHGHGITALHTAVRLGITGDVTDRLSELAADRPGPLTDIHARHGQALAASSGSALDDVAERYFGLGYVLLAAEAAAQASAAHRAAGAAGSAGGSASRARAWSEHCEGAATPALALLGGSVDLTRREMEIAALAASGLTSRAIAEELVVSVRTVDNVLRAVYAKLGVSGRGDLAQIAGLRARH